MEEADDETMYFDKLIISLEGPSGVGKTTLLKEIQKDKHPVIFEYMDYGEEFASFPPFISRNRKELESRISFFIDIEKKRSQDIKNLIKRYGYCFVDRSPLTFLAIEYAMPICYGNKVYANMRLVANMFEDAIDKQEILFPNKYILIEAPVELILKRLVSKDGVPELFSNALAVEGMYKVYKNFLEKCWDKNAYIVLQSGTLLEKSKDLWRLKISVLDFLEQQKRDGDRSNISLADSRILRNKPLTQLGFEMEKSS